MLTAGSGLTPVMSMIRTLVPRRPGRRRRAHPLGPHAGRGPLPRRAARARRPVPRACTVQHWFTREEGGRRLDLTDFADLETLCPDWRARAAYACGPRRVPRRGHGALGGHGGDDRQTNLTIERFAPVLLPGTGGEGGLRHVREVGQGDRGRTATSPLLEAGEECGVVMPSGCRMGICRSCLTPLVAGKVRDLRTGEVHGDEGELIQTCVNAAAGPVHLDI